MGVQNEEGIHVEVVSQVEVVIHDEVETLAVDATSEDEVDTSTSLRRPLLLQSDTIRWEHMQDGIPCQPYACKAVLVCGGCLLLTAAALAILAVAVLIVVPHPSCSGVDSCTGNIGTIADFSWYVFRNRCL